MHELAITQDIVDYVSEHAPRPGDQLPDATFDGPVGRSS
ncbi:hypothetical protein BH24PSE2_BH24PSE2_00410 [soil metagenome]